MDRRWIVEMPGNSVEDPVTQDVGAHACDVEDGGSLVFRGEDYRLLIAFAPGAWVSVTEQQED